DDAVEAVRSAKVHGYQNMDAIKDDLGEYAHDPRFLKALDASTEEGLDGIRIERGYKRGSLCLVKAGVGMHFLLEAQSAPHVAQLLEFLREHYPEMFGYYRPSGQLVMVPTKKGKVSRDISALRKNNSKYGFDIQYDDSEGQAPDHRFVFDDMNEKGELSVYLPLSTADDHDQLFECSIQIAQMLPFRSGCVGYTLAPFHEGNAAGPGSDARRELARLAPELLGLGLQSSKGGKIAAGIMGPSWVTLVGPALLEALPSDFRTSLEDASIHDLERGGVAIRASNAPMVGRGQNPTDLAALPQVVQALAPLWAELKLAEVQAARLQGIAEA
ncbi:MAG: type VI immunity family protein, partial [Myxococcota bacterium]